MSDLAKRIGARIRQLREARGPAATSRVGHLTIEALAEAAGLSPDYVNKLELGRHEPSAETLVRIARALGVGPGELFPESERLDAKREALGELTAFASRFSVVEIRFLVELARVALAHPLVKPTKPARRPRRL